MSDAPNLLAAAEWYARHNYFVFPLTPGTKIPIAGTGVYAATTNIIQIRRWWSDNPHYNIGIHCGPSGLLVPDLDSYKAYAGDITIDFTVTVTANTAHGGTHLWYRMPTGKRYGNQRGTLPKWLDIRGYGGYVVAPPSILLEEGKVLPYTFAPGCKPTDRDPAPLPAAIVTILDAAQAGAAASINFAEGSVDKPNLSIWDLPDDILEIIKVGAPKGERSEADYRVILALAKSDATDDQIRAVFVHFAIGAKFREKGGSGNKYLAMSIGKARTWLEDHPPDARVASLQLIAARQWVRSAACLDRLRAHGVRRVADLVPILDAIVELAQTRRTARIVTSAGAVADLCALAKSTAARRLTKLAEAGLLSLIPDQYGTLIDLTPILDAARHNEVDLSGTRTSTTTSVGRVPLGSTCDDGDFVASHRGDDAFTSYPYSYAIKRRQAPTVLMQSLGASGLLLWEALLDGGTVKELAESKGLTVASVRATLKKFGQAGLLVIWDERRAKEYELHPNAWDRLEERREHMVTAGIGQLRAARNASSIATYAQRQLQGRMPLEPREKAKLTQRRDKADGKAAAHHDALLGMGINPFIKVGPKRESRPYMKLDYRPIIDLWQELAPLPFADRYRLMGFAGYERKEIDIARRMGGRGPRHFVGVGQEATHSQSQEVAA
jgi:DNA-binding MarR family transcriptional regulator